MSRIADGTTSANRVGGGISAKPPPHRGSSPECKPPRLPKSTSSLPASSLLDLEPSSLEPVLVAVSGGRDSVVLLHYLLAQGRRQLIVCHLNHGLRGRESDLDAAFVRRLARKLELPFEIRKTPIATLAKASRLSLETAARQARHAFFLEVANLHHTPHVFLAHHAEDQAETVLANACRGTGLTGLAGMKAMQRLDNGLILHRPLLAWRRADIDIYLSAHRLRFREDSSNTSLVHRRNRLRHDVLPRLNQALERDVTPALLRLAAHAARDEDCLHRLTREWMETHAPITADGHLRITPELKALHPALLTRLLRHWLTSLDVAGVEQSHIEAALGLLFHLRPARVNLPHDLHLRRKARHLILEGR